MRLHYIAGKFDETGEVFLHADVSRCELPQLVSFSKWRLYNDFFHCKLERGDDVYNELILKFWNEVLEATEKLATYIEERLDLPPKGVISRTGFVEERGSLRGVELESEGVGLLDAAKGRVGHDEISRKSHDRACSQSR